MTSGVSTRKCMGRQGYRAFPPREIPHVGAMATHETSHSTTNETTDKTTHQSLDILSPSHGVVAQLGERLGRIEEVVSSILIHSTYRTQTPVLTGVCAL